MGFACGFVPTVLLLVVSAAALDGVEHVLGYCEFPPYTFTDESGAPAGSYVDRVVPVLAEAGIAWRAGAYPVARLYDGLARGEIHLFLGIDTSPVLQGRVLVSRRSIGAIQLLCYTMPGTREVNAEADLAGLRIGMQRGYSYGSVGDRLRAGADGTSINEMRTIEAGFQMLRAGRIDAMLHYAGPGETAVAALGLTEVERGTIFELPCYVVLSRAIPDAEALMARIDGAFDRVHPQP